MSTPAEHLPVNEVSDDQVEKFFETGGEVEIEQPKEEKAETPKEEPKEPPKEQPKEEQVKEERVVPLAALHEERTRRKELQQRLDKMEQTFQKLVSDQQQKQQPQAPDYTADPMGHLLHNQAQLAQAIQQQNEWTVQQQQAYEQQARAQQVVSRYSATAAEYAKQQPDFGNAYRYFIEQRTHEYLAHGFSPQEATQLVQQEEFGIVQKAFDDEANPAERIYKVASIRGYKPAAKEEPKQDKLEQLEKGLQAGKSLSTASGQSPKGLTLEDLANLDGEEFDKAWAKLIG